MEQNKLLQSVSLETESTSIENLRVKKSWIFIYILTMSTLVVQFGYGMCVFNPNISTFVLQFGWTPENQSSKIALLSTINPLGAIFGSFCAKFLLQYGRFKTVLIADVLIIIGTILSLFHNISFIVLGKFIIGFAGSGVASVVIPKLSKKRLYQQDIVDETAPVQYRGPLGGITQWQIFNGVLISFTLGMGVPNSPETQMTSNYWRFMFAFQGILALAHLILIIVFFRFETPKYCLFVSNELAEAHRILRQIYYEEDIQKVVDYLRHTNSQVSVRNIKNQLYILQQQSSFSQAICGPEYSKPTWIGFFLQFFNQLSGIFVINLYSSVIFRQTGAIDEQIGTFVLGIVNGLSTLIPIMLLNRFGRKTLLSVSFGVMAICLGLMSFSISKEINNLLLPMILIYAIFYQLGAGPLPYLYITETCYDAGMSFGTLSMWIWALFVSVTSPYLLNSPSFGPACTFLSLSIITCFGFIFCIVVLKETKGLTDVQCKTLFTSKSKYSYNTLQ